MHAFRILAKNLVIGCLKLTSFAVNSSDHQQQLAIVVKTRKGIDAPFIMVPMREGCEKSSCVGKTPWFDRSPGKKTEREERQPSHFHSWFCDRGGSRNPVRQLDIYMTQRFDSHPFLIIPAHGFQGLSQRWVSLYPALAPLRTGRLLLKTLWYYHCQWRYHSVFSLPYVINTSTAGALFLVIEERSAVFSDFRTAVSSALHCYCSARALIRDSVTALTVTVDVELKLAFCCRIGTFLLDRFSKQNKHREEPLKIRLGHFQSKE